MGEKKKNKIITFQPEDVRNYIDTFWKYYSSLEEDFSRVIQQVNDGNDATIALISRVKLYLAIGSEIDVLIKVICQTTDPSYSGDTFTLHREQITMMVNNYDWDSLDNEVILVEKKTVFKPWEHYEDTKLSIDWWKSYNAVKHQRACLDSSGQLFFQQATVDNILHSLGALYVLEKQYLEYMMCYLFESDESDFETCESKHFTI